PVREVALDGLAVALPAPLGERGAGREVVVEDGAQRLPRTAEVALRVFPSRISLSSVPARARASLRESSPTPATVTRRVRPVPLTTRWAMKVCESETPETRRPKPLGSASQNISCLPLGRGALIRSIARSGAPSVAPEAGFLQAAPAADLAGVVSKARSPPAR